MCVCLCVCNCTCCCLAVSSSHYNPVGSQFPGSTVCLMIEKEMDKNLLDKNLIPWYPSQDKLNPKNTEFSPFPLLFSPFIWALSFVSVHKRIPNLQFCTCNFYGVLTFSNKIKQPGHSLEDWLVIFIRFSPMFIFFSYTGTQLVDQDSLSK